MTMYKHYMSVKAFLKKKFQKLFDKGHGTTTDYQWDKEVVSNTGQQKSAGYVAVLDPT